MARTSEFRLTLCNIYVRSAKPLYSHGLSRPRASGRAEDRGISFTDGAGHPGKSGRQVCKSNSEAVARRSATSDKVCYVNLREGRVLEPTTGDSSLTPRWYDGLLASPDVQGALARRLMGDRNLDSAAKSASNPPDN